MAPNRIGGCYFRCWPRCTALDRRTEAIQTLSGTSGVRQHHFFWEELLNTGARLNVRPEADTETVEDLVARARRGLVRIPVFQRGLKWKAMDVISLFDSIYNGYPIGSLLLRKGAAKATQIAVGPLKIDAPETHEALWVVDGQQRLTALTAVLTRPTPIPVTPEDPFVVYFDAASRTFEQPPKSGIIPDTWVPVPYLLDASALSEWVFEWKHAKDALLRSSVFEVGTRLRQYRIPLYIVDTNDEELLREIFYRTNTTGKRLEWTEVHDALFGQSNADPSTLPALSEELNQLGMGRPDERLLLSCVAAYQGLDVTRNITEHHRRDPDILRNVVSEALPAIRQVLSFLRKEAEIPHLRLLPRTMPIIVLTRFFRLFPNPNYRTLHLLTRWTWRTLLATALFDERTLLRRGVSLMREGDAEGSVAELLKLVPHILPAELEFDLPNRFDARAAESRLALLGMTTLCPLRIDTLHRVDVASLIEEHDVAAFRIIIPGGDPSAQSPANRILLPGIGSAKKELLEVSERTDDEAVFASHGITSLAKAALKQGDVHTFLEQRRLEINSAVRTMGDRLAGWSRSDRPSISYMLTQTERTK